MVKATVKGMLTPEQMVAARLMPGRGVALVRPNGQNVDFPNPGGKRLDEFGLYIAPNGARYGYFPHQKLYAGPTMDGFLAYDLEATDYTSAREEVKRRKCLFI